MSETDKSPQQRDGGTAAPNESLSYDEVSKHFSMPIAEAANILGVCTSILKKICRDNGLVRWPYRKLERQLKKLKNMPLDKEGAGWVSRAAIKRMEDSATMSLSSVVSPTFGIQLQIRTPSSVQDSSKSQQGNVQMVGQASQQQANRLLQQGRQNMLHSSQTKNIPTYLDEFKHGFPTNGLSSISTKWWGTSSLDGNTMLEEAEHSAEAASKQPSGESPGDMTATEEKTEREMKKVDNGAAVLLSLRKRASEDGREAVKLGVARGYGAYKLRRKERAMLLQIFKSSYPSEWK